MRPPSLKPLLAVTTLATLAAWRVARLLAGAIGLQHEFGLVWAGIGVSCLVLLRFAAPIRIGALLAAVSLWHWPWLAGLFFAAPRILTVIPGLWSTGMAQLRHPRPVWRDRVSRDPVWRDVRTA